MVTATGSLFSFSLSLACLGWPSSCLLSGDSVQPTVGCAWRAQRDQLSRPVPTQNHRGDVVMVELWGIPSGPAWDGSTERKKQKGCDGWGVLALAYKPQSKELFHTLLNTCCHWQMYKCVNTLEAYSETQTGLGIVMCKLKKADCVRMKTAFISNMHTVCLYVEPLTLSRIQNSTLCNIMLVHKHVSLFLTCRGPRMDCSSSTLDYSFSILILLLFPHVFLYFLLSLTLFFSSLLSSLKKSWLQ